MRPPGCARAADERAGERAGSGVVLRIAPAGRPCPCSQRRWLLAVGDHAPDTARSIFAPHSWRAAGRWSRTSTPNEPPSDDRDTGHAQRAARRCRRVSAAQQQRKHALAADIHTALVRLRPQEHVQGLSTTQQHSADVAGRCAHLPDGCKDELPAARHAHGASRARCKPATRSARLKHSRTATTCCTKPAERNVADAARTLAEGGAAAGDDARGDDEPGESDGDSDDDAASLKASVSPRTPAAAPRRVR